MECDDAADGPPSWTVSARPMRSCGSESRSLLRAHDQPDSLLDQPIVGPASYGIVPVTETRR